MFAVASIQPQWDGPDCTEKETPNQRMVRGVETKKLARTDDTPENTAVEMNSGNWTGEAIECFGGANIWNVDKHPIEYPYLGD